MKILMIIAGVTICIAAVLLTWRMVDRAAEHRVWQKLAEPQDVHKRLFEYAMVADLPEPAQRYFRYTIAPGTPLHTGAVIEMSGELGLGTREDPRYGLMQARQILAPPHGLLWSLRYGAIGGSDAVTKDGSWTRFWLFGLIPVVRAGNDADHHRSALGRMVAEAVFWTPAALLSGKHVQWQSVDAQTARAMVRFGPFEQAVDVTVAQDGQPQHVVIQRWSNANSDRQYRLQPFGGTLRDFREFEGFRLPTHVEGGNLFGTDDYFPFYKANVSSVEWIK